MALDLFTHLFCYLWRRVAYLIPSSVDNILSVMYFANILRTTIVNKFNQYLQTLLIVYFLPDIVPLVIAFICISEIRLYVEIENILSASLFGNICTRISAKYLPADKLFRVYQTVTESSFKSCLNMLPPSQAKKLSKKYKYYPKIKLMSV